MNIWLVQISEPLPSDNGVERLLRTGIIANILSARKHNLTWFTSTFHHGLKKHRFDKDTTIKINDNYNIRLIHGIGYKRHIGIRRLLDHVLIARKFRRIILLEGLKPDIILASIPTVELGYECVRFGNLNNIPVILDCRDCWPDVFIESFHALIKPLIKMLLYPFFTLAKSTFSGATAVTGITNEFVSWGLGYANRAARQFDKEFYLGYVKKSFSDEELQKADNFWINKGIEGNDFLICFFSSFGKHINLNYVIDTAKKLHNTNIKFVLCGTGDMLKHYQDRVLGMSNVLLPGWVKWPQIYSLMQKSKLGLVPIQSRFDFQLSIPNKPIEYLSAGLPILSSLKGKLESILKEYNCGLTYTEGNSEALFDAIMLLYSNKKLLTKMSQNAIELFNKCFDAEHVYTNFADHLEMIVNTAKKVKRMGNRKNGL